MADLPFILFPRPQRTARGVPPGGGRAFTKPTPAQQRARLQARFDQIVQSFQNLQATVAGFDPEQVIVLETLTASVENVAKAVVQIPGLEWLAERDLEEVPPEFGFGDPATDTTIPKRLYALMSNQNGMTQLLALWNDWVANPDQRARKNFGPFKQLFILLRDIRRWSAQDRIETTGILDSWREEVEVRITILFEIEFWFRGQQAQRQRAYAEIENLVQGLGGQCLDQATIPEIFYHAALVELPTAVVNQFIAGVQAQDYAQLLRSEGVMFFRPRAQSVLGLQTTEPVNLDFATRLRDRPIEAGEPVIAVLDGVPVENHAALAGRLVVDDPDGHAPMYQAGQQQHGTAMASVVVHGDLNGNGPSLKRRIYVRPIFHPDIFNLREITPPNRLLVDLIHRAIRRIFDGDGAQPASAPTVRIVNLALGNPEQPFDREISPLGRLLDWLSWKYKVLILVSIGNRIVPMNLGAALDGVEDEDVIVRVLQAMRVEQIQKRPLSPAEAINCLSVGAVHADESPAYVAGNRVDLLRDRRLPTPINTIATGFRRSTKPEVLFPGGRLLYQQDPPNGNGGVFSAVQSVRAPGIMAAAPGIAPMEVNRVGHSCGSSNATALASRCAVLAYETISAMEIPPDCEPLDAAYEAVLLKALLVHGASWGDASRLIEKAFPIAGDQWQRLSRIKQQFLGYGEVDIKRCLSANEQRATLLGWSMISDGEGHIFEMPLPPALAASTELRRLTATLAWLTPTNQQHKDYRKAYLWIDVPEQNIGTQRDGLDAASARRGTVEHRIFKGTNAVPFIDGTKLRIVVSCKEDAGTLDVAVPYAVAVTLEVGPDVQIDIYQQINFRIRPVVEIQARP